MTISYEQYSAYKINGAIVTGSRDIPQLTTRNYNSLSGIRELDTQTIIDTRAVDYWITFYQKKLDNLQALKADIAKLP